ncbi:ABC transporter ATP-binding protein [Candidatus Aminicenantes bacterium AC-708-M15]|jgi:ABC-2 type transport system ATP-binding protein|nr:ABC transporter ATP-binding protein [SCandidatus Aminicenantes bacterium Aminicenantia_JdfR_composite]MCP2604246.1 ABC transporter ATP-binding protein [Candidatus Aminicenantes bacterium AC-708-M15]MCP2606451.1 ABC transporter ATP-binding protein [Candidatus Aminicenantes bacterium AC-708-I09]MCP2618159.1 ABC transporter ATP-binding protein [Candidatus Aminicenantes bacterium AC-335-A11]
MFAIEVYNLTKKFGEFVAVNNISFKVAKGEIFGFLGPNGAGKSTTIRMLCGIMRPTSGEGLVGGYSINNQPEEIKKIIGYMSQKFTLYQDLTVEENINFYGGIHGLSSSAIKERKKWVIKMAGLIGKENYLTRELSGGWKQRLSLGCAILHQPEILFLDEPTASVDPISRRDFWDLIYNLSEKGTTIFVTSHYMDEVERCHRIAIIYSGKIIAMGSPKELKKEFTKSEKSTLEEVFISAIEREK